MKNRLLTLIFACFFVLSNSAIAHQLDGGIVLGVVFGKNVTPVCTISIPDKYVEKNGDFGIPAEITLTSSAGATVVQIMSLSPHCQMPTLPSGLYVVEVKIGDFSTSQEIKL